MQRHSRACGRPVPSAMALAALLLPIIASPAQAQAQLYEAVPPPGSAYLRFANALPGSAAVAPNFLPRQQLGTTPQQRVSAYAVVQRVAGRRLTLELSDGTASGTLEFGVEPGGFTTILLHALPQGGIGATAVTDQADFNRARARLSFYNAAPTCAEASLALEPGGPMVFEHLAPASVKTRAVTPTSATLRASCAEAAAPPVALTGLEAGGTYSIWLMRPTPGEPIAFLLADTTARWRP